MKAATRALLAGTTAIGILASLPGGITVAQQAPEPQLVRVSVKRFAYDPPEIRLRFGVPVVIELRTEDLPHGFVQPDLKIHADVLPGQIVRVPLVPGTAGSFLFHCDLFCGSGHEEMGGRIVVDR